MKTHFKYDELIVVCDLEEDHVHFKVNVIFFLSSIVYVKLFHFKILIDVILDF